MARTLSLAEVIAKLDAGDTEDARTVLVHMRQELLKSRGEFIPAKEHCLECGPHGNRGRVCLLLTWADCSLCSTTKVDVVI